MTDTFYTASSFSEVKSEIEAALSSLITGYTGTNTELGAELTSLISRLIVTGTVSYEIQVAGTDQYLVNGDTFTLTQLIANMESTVGSVRDVLDFFGLLPSYETDFQLWNSDGSQILGGTVSTEDVAPTDYKSKLEILMAAAIDEGVNFDLVSKIKVVGMDSQDLLATKYVVDGETLFSELSERELDNIFKAQNAGAYFAAGDPQKEFLFLDSITVPQIDFEYKIGSDVHAKTVSWNEIDISGSSDPHHVYFSDFGNTSTGDDLVYGTSENDSQIIDKDGHDIYLGFAGDDTFQSRSEIDGNIYHGGYGNSSGNADGVDTINYKDLSYGISVSLADGSSIGLAQKSDFTGLQDQLISIENIVGSNHDDFLDGNNLKNQIEAGRGYDIAQGFGGDDRFIAHFESSVMGSSRNGDSYDGGDGTDSIIYMSGLEQGVHAKYNGLVAGQAVITVSDVENFSAGAHYDTLTSIENIELTQSVDSFTITTLSGLENLSVDALSSGGVGSTGKDKLVFSDMAEGIELVNGVVQGTSTTVGFRNFEEIIGTDSTDKITNGGSEAEQFNSIKTEAGDDEVISFSTSGVQIDLGLGNDKLKISGTGSVIYTGVGEDKVTIALRDDGQAYVADANADDQIINFGEVLTGASKWYASESAWTDWTDGVRYSLNQLGELVIENLLGGTVFVANFNNDPNAGTSALTAGIKLYELAWGAYLVFREAPPEWGDFHQTPETLAFKVKEIMRDANPAYDPLVLDLDGDGIELTTLSSFAPQFDLNADGFAERTGWASGDDGMLAIDLNSNGVIDNGGELFGNATTGGLAALSAYDTDLDGSITAADAAFSSLKVWRDLDQDGVSDVNELKTLSESGIVSISLVPTSITPTTQAGNTIAATGTYTKSDGSTGTTGDVILNSNGYDTKWLGSVTVSPEVSAMANLKGHGTLPDLHKAMALDSDLVTAANSVLPTLNAPDLDALRTNVIPFLSAWMDSVDVPAGMPGTQARIDVPIKVTSDAVHGPQVQDFAIQKSDGSGTYWVLASGAVVVDGLGNPIARPTLADIQAQGGTWDSLPASVISFMERWTGLNMPIGLDGGETGSDAVNGAKDLTNTIWQELQMITVRLASQGGLAGYFEGISYDVGSDKFVPTTDSQLTPFFQNIFEGAPGNVSGDEAWIQSWKPLVDVVLNDYDRPGSLEISYSYLLQNIVAAYENAPLSASLVNVAEEFGVPSEQIITGTGTLIGTNDNDLFYLGEGNQIAQGGSGPDSYVVGRNFGQDVIDDTEHTLGTDLPDSVRFAHLKSTDVTLTRDQSDLIISVNGSTDQLRIVGEFATRYPSITGYINDAHGVSELVFADGIVWDKVDMARQSSHAQATNDIIYGTGQIDFLDGGAGNDYLSGSNEGDVYIYGRGYGQDVIEDEGAEFSTPNTDAYDPYYTFLIDSPDILDLKNLTMNDVSFSRSGENGLLISVNGTTDTLLINNQFNAYYGVPGVGKVFADQIEFISFADGQTLSATELMSKMVAEAKTAGNDTIIGFSNEDVLDGGAGDDYLSGLDEADTYVFGRGYGHDTIFEGLPASALTEGSNIDRLLFNDDVAPEDIVVSRGSGIDDFKLTISDTGDSITILDQATEWVVGNNFYEIEEIKFSNGAVWTTNDLQEQYLTDVSTTGNDTIVGFMRNDTLNGLAGNDRLEGRGGSDTYVFDVGFGQDVIYDYPEYTTWNTADTVQFTGTWVPSDFSFSKVGYDLVLQSLSTSDKLTVEDFFSSISLFRIENFVFSNGAVLTDNDIYTSVMGGSLIVGTDGSEILTGNSGHNQIEGLGGNDTLKGLDGNDILVGGDGNDRLEGGNDGDVYIVGSGTDTIKEQSGNDEIVFGSGVTLADLDIYRLYEGMYDEHLIINWSGGSIKVEQHFYDTSTDGRVEQIRFDDGSTYDLLANNFITKGTVAADTLAGEKWSLFGKDDTIYGYDGNDTIQGLVGNDSLYGGTGNDTLQGGDGNDTLDGGDEDDYLEGGDGGDVYIHSGGNDTIAESYSGSGGIDKIVFGANISLSDLSLYRIANSLKIEVSDGSLITVSNHFNTVFSMSIEALLFTDGSTYNFDESHQIEIHGTGADDTINGNSLNASINDVIHGYGGNDTISAKSGDDTVYGEEGNDSVNGEDGNDSLYGGVGIDTLNGGNNDDYIDGGADVDTIDAGSGNDTVIGGVGNDIIHGKAGHDYLQGGDGDDTIYEIYSGNDVIDGGTGIDTLDYSGASTYAININLQTGIQSDNYSMPSSDVIAGIENVIGGNGSDTITGNGVANNLQGGSGNDKLYGGEGDDVLIGGTGNDILEGGTGIDTVSYVSATGAVTVNLAVASTQNTVGAGTDTITLVENIIGSTFNDTLTGDVNANTLEGGVGNDIIHGGLGIDTLSYSSSASAVTVSLEQITSQDTVGAGTDTISGFENLFGSAYNDTLAGNASDNIIHGGIGNDVLMGLSGADTIYGGDGQDLLTYVSALSAINVNLFSGAGYLGDAFGDVLIDVEDVQGSAFNDTIIGSNGNNTLNGENGIDTVSYETATSAVTVNLEITTIQNTFGAGVDTLSNFENIVGSAFDDNLTGNYSVNTISGGLGSDTLQGGGGIDTLDGGDGIDTVSYVGAIDSVNIDLRVGITNDDGTGVSDVLQSVENITGSSYDDIAIGDNGLNIIDGGNGNDLIDGALGNDTLIGGMGMDTLSYVSAAAGVQINLSLTIAQNTFGAGVDTVSGFENLTGSIYNDTLVGDGNDNIIDGGSGAGYDNLNGGDGIDTLSYASASAGVNVTLATTAQQYTAGAGKDIVIGFENLTGSDFGDGLTGDAGSNIISGRAGNDSLTGGGGDDTLIGGEGDDSINGGEGNDTYYYTSGRDTLTETGAGADKIIFDSIWSPYNVIILGNSQILLHDQNKITFNDIGLVETFSFSGFADMTLSELATFQTAKVLEGTSGNDNFEATLFIEAFNGGDGVDTVDFKASVAGISIDLQNAYADGGEASGDTLISIENIKGSDIASVIDTIYGDAQVNEFYGMAGNDILEGAGGADVLDGGAGQDYARYTRSASAVYVDIATGINTGGDASGDTLISIENLVGSAYNDILTGSAIANIIDGGNGDDILNGAGGVDTLIYVSALAAVQVDLSITASQNTAGSGYDTLSGFENIKGSSYDDILSGDGGDNTIEGGNGNDIIYGGVGIDTISYSSATSKVNFNLSLTTAQYTKGAGTDTVSGFENIMGSSYNDDLIGDGNDNIIDGGAGTGYDNLNGGYGTDTVSYASASAGVLVNIFTTSQQNTVGAGKDILAGFENIMGSFYADTLTGDANSNMIDGGAGNDTISAGAGIDTLIGGAGTDVLTGGLDGDIFLFDVAGMSSIDTVKDFSMSQVDKIDLSSLLVGYDELTSAITDFVELTTSGLNTIAKVDRDGAGSTYGWQQIATLESVTGLTDEATLKASGNLIVA